MSVKQKIQSDFNSFWDENLLPAYKTIEGSSNNCEKVTDEDEYMVKRNIKQLLDEALDLKRNLLFDQANQKYISIASFMLSQFGVVHRTVLLNWFKILAPVTLFEEALKAVMFSRLICIRLVQRSLKLGDMNAARSHFYPHSFDHLRKFGYALTGDTEELRKYLAEIVGNPAYELPRFKRPISTNETFTENIETLKRVLKDTNNIFFAFYSAGVRTHGEGWTIVNENAPCGFQEDGEYVETGHLIPTGWFGGDDKGTANRALNVLFDTFLLQS